MSPKTPKPKPSSADTWGAPWGCPASIIMRHMYPSEKGVDAQIGLCAHKLAGDLIYHGAGRLRSWEEMRAKYVDKYTLEGVKVTDEIFDLCVPYVNDVIATAGTAHFGNIESKVVCAEVHPNCWGYVDFWVRIGNDLYVWEFKSGRRPVEVFENRQCAAYASAILGLTSEPVERVIFRVVQPRSFDYEPVKEWTTTPRRIQAIAEEMRAAANNAFGPSPIARTGAHCRNCSARLHCEAQQKAAYHTLESLGTIMPRDLTPQQAGRELEIFQAAAEQLQYRLTALEAEVESLINAGHTDVAQWSVTYGQGKLVWDEKVDVDELEAVGAAYEVDLVKKVPITPTQAKNAGVPAELVSELSKRTPGRKKLKHANLREARKVFGG